MGNSSLFLVMRIVCSPKKLLPVKMVIASSVNSITYDSNVKGLSVVFSESFEAVSILE